MKIYLDSSFCRYLADDSMMQDLNKFDLLIEDLYNADLEVIG